jgi:DNA-binding GntR family transcriptional regulator
MLDKSSALFAVQPPAPTAKNAFALERLRQAVLWCELTPGAIVSEDILARQFRLGRAAVRSALARLAAEGFVQARPRRGWSIAPITGALLEDLLDARRLVEPRLATLELPAEELERLRVLAGFLTELRRAADPQSLVTARQYDRQLMDSLAQHAGSFVARWLGDVWRHGDRMVRFFERAEARLAAPDRQALVDALARRDAAAAAAALEAEIQRLSDFLTRQIVRSASWGTPDMTAPRRGAGPKFTRSTNRRKRTPSSQQGDKWP